MGFKSTTILIFTCLLLIVSYFMFRSDFSDATMGWILMGGAMPALVIWQVVAILRSSEPDPLEHSEGTYEND